MQALYDLINRLKNQNPGNKNADKIQDVGGRRPETDAEGLQTTLGQVQELSQVRDLGQLPKVAELRVVKTRKETGDGANITGFQWSRCPRRF